MKMIVKTITRLRKLVSEWTGLSDVLSNIVILIMSFGFFSLAIVEASDRDDIEFIKLLNVKLNMSNNGKCYKCIYLAHVYCKINSDYITLGMLVDLHVSMLGDPDQDYERFVNASICRFKHTT
jgi:hypothetical protein